MASGAVTVTEDGVEYPLTLPKHLEEILENRIQLEQKHAALLHHFVHERALQGDVKARELLDTLGFGFSELMAQFLKERKLCQ